MTDPITYQKRQKLPVSDNWQTPSDLYRLADAAFGPFGLDAAATPAVALAPRWLGEQPDGSFIDALRMDDPWMTKLEVDAGLHTWLNPPYSRAAGPLEDWVDRAYWESREHGHRVVLLMKVDTSTTWFSHLWHKAKLIVFLAPRVSHLMGGKAVKTPPWGSLLAVMDGDRGEGAPLVRLVQWK